MGASCRFFWWQGLPWALKAELQPKIEQLEKGTNVVPVFSSFSLKLFLEEGCLQAQTSPVTLGRECGMWKGGVTVCFYSPSLWTNRSAVTNTPDPCNAAISQELHSLVGHFEALSHGWCWEQTKCWDFELDASLLTSALCFLPSGKKMLWISGQTVVLLGN